MDCRIGRIESLLVCSLEDKKIRTTQDHFTPKLQRCLTTARSNSHKQPKQSTKRKQPAISQQSSSISTKIAIAREGQRKGIAFLIRAWEFRERIFPGTVQNQLTNNMPVQKRNLAMTATSEVATSSSSSGISTKLSILVALLCACMANGFVPSSSIRSASWNVQQSVLQMSYYDMSDYSSGPSDYDDDSEVGESAYAGMRDAAEKAAAESVANEVKLEQPPPLSKNAGNAFVALVFDKALDTHGREWDDLMEDRIVDTGKHVRWCREANLYNETINTGSMVDVRRSYQV